ncbi:hypothetical protein TrST_g6266 [Triparma strigata]|uniref:Kinesin-like protein n=1 Tax=Triparma strigata TaxID=1606541 RepID=A0A9W7BYV2_9STRA|nr:hypothetical protein TrST_g6266 [Triparma strigata]
MSSSASTTSINVCVRVRPLHLKAPPPATPAGAPLTVECWNLSGNVIQPNPDYESYLYDQMNSKNKRTAYAFDHLFYPNSQTASIYNLAVKNVVEASMGGYHGSVFAYGQTSTGKTYTMQGTGDNPGVVPLAVTDCFRYIEESKDREFLLRVSYMEIYNEQINDLFAPSSVNSIRIYEHRGKGVVIKGMKEEVVMSPDQVFALVSAGEAHRHIGATEMNENSSRSHTIFRLVIESRALRGRKNGNGVTVSTLSLVDLAGSESAAQANTKGSRRSEGHFINKSLLTLGHVIWKLSEASRKNIKVEDIAQHIPYRDSKLTRLLQPSLGGNAQISIICNVSPEGKHAEETHNTLKFASRAKRIKQQARVTQVLDDATMLQQYREEIGILRTQLNSLAVQNKNFQEQLMSPKGVAQDDDEGEDEEETQHIQAAIRNLERLILKSADERKRGGSPRRSSEHSPKNSFFGDGNAPGKNNLFFKRNRSSSLTVDVERSSGLTSIGDKGGEMQSTPKDVDMETPTTSNRPQAADRKRATSIDDEMAAVGSIYVAGGDVDRIRTSSVRSGTPESSASNMDSVSLVNELQRVQGLLGAVLEKKNNRKTAPSKIQQPTNFTANLNLDLNSLPPTPGGGSDIPTNFSSKDEEIAALKSSNKKLEMEKRLRKADAQFLEQSLNDKDQMLCEVANVLDAVEKHQESLEKENTELAEALSRMQSILASRESELLRIKGINADEEVF